MLRCPPQGACWTGAQPARPTSLLSPGHPPSILHGTLLGHHIPLHLGPLPRGLLRTRVNKCSLDDVRISRIYTPTRGIRGCAVQCVYLWTAVSNVAGAFDRATSPPAPGPAPLSPRGVVGALRSLAWRVQRARRDRNLHFSERRGVFLHVLTSHLVKGLAYCFKLGCWLIEFFFFLNAGEVFQQTCFMTISE